MLSGQKGWNRNGFVLMEAIVALILVMLTCGFVAGVNTAMSNRLSTEQRRTDTARIQFEKTSQRLGNSFDE